MSLLHDALKKAERQRKLGQAPTLDSPRFRRRRKRWPWFIVLLLVAGLAGAWFLREPLLHKARTTLAFLRSDSPASVKEQPPSGADKPLAAAGGQQPSRSGQAPAAAAQQRTAPAAQPAKQAPGRTPSPNAAKPKPPASTPPASAPGAAQGTNAGTVASQAEQSAERQPATTPAERPSPPAPKLSRGQLKPKGPPMYWELPYAERKDLPDFDISMHVYTDDPAGRFVILNGERQVEGDTLTSGQKLIAINPDSITLEDNGHTFRVPRQGSH